MKKFVDFWLALPPGGRLLLVALPLYLIVTIAYHVMRFE